MKVGCLKEIKTGENRVGLTPAGVRAFVSRKHEVFIEKDAGVGSGFSNEEYEKAGARLLDAPKEVSSQSEMIIKVKEPIKQEWDVLREGQILFTFLHLAATREITEFLLEKKITAIAYETVELENGNLPLLTPMSAVAGRMAVQVGAHYLERTQGGSGTLLSGVEGVEPGKVVIIGTGIVGMNACKIAFGMGADVTMIGRNPDQRKKIEDLYDGKVKTLESNSSNIEKAVREADLVIGGVAATGEAAPTLVTREMVKIMEKGSVIIDVAVDQGGIVETIRPTTHENPIYVEEGIIHYGVTNMPGAVPHTSTLALTNATLPYALEIADKGIPAVFNSPALLKGLNTYQGKLTNKGVAEALGMKWEEIRF